MGETLKPADDVSAGSFFCETQKSAAEDFFLCVKIWTSTPKRF
jgi:hypothetical protein